MKQYLDLLQEIMDHGVALECQHCPDSPNQPKFPTTTLRPGRVLHEAIIFAFSVQK